MANSFYEIHPAIGIARVGSSVAPGSDDHFIGYDPDVAEPSSRRDQTSDKKLLRQAARFRVFRCERDDQGKLVATPEEMTADKASLSWTVHLVNRKAAAPRFIFPPGTGTVNTDPTKRRNNATGNPGTDASLIIDPGPKSLTGANQPRLTLNGGRFRGAPVDLGAIYTDGSGRLVVVPARGHSDSVPSGSPLTDFADSDNWFDDTADGPVSVAIRLADGTNVGPAQIKPAWVACCQPDYAPGINNLITLLDVLLDLGVTRKLYVPPAKPAYDRDIKPILDRVLGYRWVNQDAYTGHGPGGLGNFDDRALFGDLSTPGVNSNARVRIFRMLRDPGGSPQNPKPRMPWLFADGYPTDSLPLPMTALQYGMLKAWSVDLFITTAAAGPAEELPDKLTRIVLQACVGGAFYPGIELGRRMRTDIYMAGELFRIDHSKVEPGGLTQSMALPWQADFIDCATEQLAGQTHNLHWWPAQRPNEVFADVGSASSAAGAAGMVDWATPIAGGRDMVDRWDMLGVVIKAKLPDGTEGYVETERGFGPR
ncbi:MAG: LodA/GoxA family CTQ-dependent oxidase [Isosphaeraceae bacterium]